MCKHNNQLSNLFDLYNITNDFTSKVKALHYSSVLNVDGYKSDETDIYKLLLEQFKNGKITAKEINAMPDLPVWFMDAMNAYIIEKLAFGENVTRKTLNKTKSNLKNYSIAKTYKLFQGLKKIASNGGDDLDNTFTSYVNLMLNTQQAVEDFQTERITENYSTVNHGGLCEYVSRKDSNVRDSHEHADGTILASTNSWWNSTGLKLLSEWSCRCSIVRSSADKPNLTYQADKIKAKGIETNSNVNLKDGTVIIFSEKLPMFNDIPAVIRRSFNKNGF